MKQWKDNWYSLASYTGTINSQPLLPSLEITYNANLVIELIRMNDLCCLAWMNLKGEPRRSLGCTGIPGGEVHHPTWVTPRPCWEWEHHWAPSQCIGMEITGPVPGRRKEGAWVHQQPPVVFAIVFQKALGESLNLIRRFVHDTGTRCRYRRRSILGWSGKF